MNTILSTALLLAALPLALPAQARSTLSNVTQTGQNNVANVGQEQTGGPTSRIIIAQDGADNIAVTRQEHGYGAGIEAHQLGSRNRADLIQQNFSPLYMQTEQTGSDNTILIREHRSGAAGPTVTQQGVENHATVLQENDAHSRLEIRQSGVRNDANVVYSDTSFNERSVITQAGEAHYADIFSTGNFNGMTVTQSGYNASAMVHQAGDRNRGVIVQH